MRMYQIKCTQTLRNEYKVCKRLPSIKLPCLSVTKFAPERTNLHSQLDINQNSLFHLIALSLKSQLN